MVLCGLGDSLYIKNDWCGSNIFWWIGEPIYMGGILMGLIELGNHFDDEVALFVQTIRWVPHEKIPCRMFLQE